MNNILFNVAIKFGLNKKEALLIFEVIHNS